MKKIIIAIIAIATMMTMVSCKQEPKSETTDDTLVLSSGVEVTFGEVILGEMNPNGTIIEENIIEENFIEEDFIEESTPKVSDEYRAEVEFNSQTNRW